jgi:hypothetical protein
MRSAVHALGLALLLSSASCYPHLSANSSRGNNATSAATVLYANQIRESSASTLLAALRHRVIGLQVRQGDSCPVLLLRGQHSLNGDNNPAVYVDGARAANTCVLDMLFPLDVERVEVYPMGIAPRPPYKAHPNGLILVFMQDGLLD